MNIHERADIHLELNVELGEEERVGVGRGGEGECEISHYICREYSERLTAVWACLNELQDLQFTWESIRMGKHYQKTTTTTHTRTHARTG